MKAYRKGLGYVTPNTTRDLPAHQELALHILMQAMDEAYGGKNVYEIIQRKAIKFLESKHAQRLCDFLEIDYGQIFDVVYTIHENLDYRKKWRKKNATQSRG